MNASLRHYCKLHVLALALSLICAESVSAANLSEATADAATPSGRPGEMLATWRFHETPADKVVMNSKHVFILTLVVSVFYLFLLYAVLFWMPNRQPEFADYLKNVLKTSSWFLGSIQAIVIGLLGKFFFEAQ